MLIGYARVSTEFQNLDRQIDAIVQAGVDERNIYKEKITGTKKDRPMLNKMLSELKKDDVIIVADITRISRSTKDLLTIVDEVKNKEASIKSLKDTWLNTTKDNPQNQFLLTIMAALSQLERDLISQRTREGLESARARGRKGGRKPVDVKIIDRAIKLYLSKEYTLAEIEEMTGISKMTLYRKLKEHENKKI